MFFSKDTALNTQFSGFFKIRHGSGVCLTCQESVVQMAVFDTCRTWTRGSLWSFHASSRATLQITHKRERVHKRGEDVKLSVGTSLRNYTSSRSKQKNIPVHSSQCDN